MQAERKLNEMLRSITLDMQRVGKRLATCAVLVRDRLQLKPDRTVGDVLLRAEKDGEVVAYFRIKDGRDVLECVIKKLPEGSRL